jgi:hypothetical protein
MGQATLDLPDPTQLSGVDAGPLSPEALASADDLLSQLAGDDIDRLLAEADADRASSPASADSAVAPSPPIEPTAADSVAAADAAIDAIMVPAVESQLEEVEKQLAALEQAVQDTAPPPATAFSTPAQEPPATEKADEKVLDEAAAHVAAIMHEPEPATELAASTPAADAGADAAERAALAEPLPLPAASTPAPRRLRPLLLILELINWPMRLVSDEMREAIGKVALVTTFNAAAVLIYVMLFRHPHH